MALLTPVDAPLPAPSRRSLLEVSRILNRVVDGTVTLNPEDVASQDAPFTSSGAPDWARGGVAFRADGCGDAEVWEPCAENEPGDSIPSDAGDLIEAATTVVRVGTRCSTMGDVTTATRDRAVRLLNVWQHHQIAAEFWRGDRAAAGSTGTPYLSEDARILGTDLSLIDGLGALEAAVTGGQEDSACGPGQRAMIHASPRTVSAWAALGQLRAEGGLLLTALDSVVVTGPGYDGSGTPGPQDAPYMVGGTPTADASDDRHWAYGTGFVEVRLGPARVYTVIDQAANDRIAWAERPAVVTMPPCCVVSVSLDLSDRS